MDRKPKKTAPRRCGRDPGCREFHPCRKHPWGWRKNDDTYQLPSNWKALTSLVIEQSGGKCKRCGRLANPGSVDHIQNIASGGTHDIWNLQLLCKSCHDFKTRKESRDGRKRT